MPQPHLPLPIAICIGEDTSLQLDGDGKDEATRHLLRMHFELRFRVQLVAGQLTALQKED